MVSRKKGALFVVSAPSGGGKSTLLRKVISQLPGVSISISYTTRPPRSEERDGVDYFFVSHREFIDMVSDGKFIEWAEVHGYLYGTPRANLEKLMQGEDLILEIDTQGARKIRQEFRNGVLIFILSPSLEVLGERLRARGGDTEEAIQARLQYARKELDQVAWYDYIVINREIEEATKELTSIIIAERCKAARVLEGIGGKYGKNNG
ncbi:MAG: guanylate kinase [Deltaproteobacteria bacterium]|nr:MAG: guanylate kinase [Deltaproteobacteria bacterium]